MNSLRKVVVPHRLIAIILAIVIIQPTSAAAGQSLAAEPQPARTPDDNPIRGRWYGMLDGEFFQPFLVIEIQPIDTGQPELPVVAEQWEVRATLAIVGIVNAPAREATIDGRRITATIGRGSTVMMIDGMFDDQSGRLDITTTVTVDQESMDYSGSLTRQVPVMEQVGPMAFTGRLTGAGAFQLDITIALAQTSDGTWIGHIDIPLQQIYAYPLIDLERDGDVIQARMVLSSHADARIEANIDEDGRRLAGTFRQGPVEMTLELRRDREYAGPMPRRPQHPKPPFDYHVKEVRIEHPDGHVLAGTLTIPHGEGPFPVVITITGSGPQDRDETLFGHKPFLVIADRLTTGGIAVLRCDDRGVGESTGDFSTATSADFATDVIAQIDFLSRRDDTDAERIGLLGHSEGGLIAPKVAGMDDRVAYLVLLAGPAVSGRELLPHQMALLLRATVTEEAQVEKILAAQTCLLDAIVADAPTEDLASAARKLIAAQGGLPAIDDIEEVSEEVINATVNAVASPWMKFFLTYDPRPALKEIDVPTLALFGSLDLQVCPEQNAPVMESIAEEHGVPIEIIVVENVNHLFQPTTTGGIDEYARIETTIDEHVLELISNWVRRITGVIPDAAEEIEEVE